jgi:hypothetical protein
MKWVLCGMLLFVAFGGRGQTFGEWFEQTKTEHRYYLQQVAALQVYIGAVEKGYAVVESGLQAIGGIKKGEFDLHSGFYGELDSLNPALGGLGGLAEIVALQAAMVERFSSALARYRAGTGLGVDELKGLSDLYSAVLKAGLDDVTALLAITQAHGLKMSDDERMRRIREVDAGMRDRYRLTAEVTNEADLLCVQRQGAALEAGTVMGLGLP